jgi:hypothetical protein
VDWQGMFRPEDSFEALSLVEATQKRDNFALASMETLFAD